MDWAGDMIYGILMMWAWASIFFACCCYSADEAGTVDPEHRGIALALALLWPIVCPLFVVTCFVSYLGRKMS